MLMVWKNRKILFCTILWHSCMQTWNWKATCFYKCLLLYRTKKSIFLCLVHWLCSQCGLLQSKAGSEVWVCDIETFSSCPCLTLCGIQAASESWEILFSHFHRIACLRYCWQVVHIWRRTELLVLYGLQDIASRVAKVREYIHMCVHVF